MGNHCCNKMSSSRNSKLDSKLDSMKFEPHRAYSVRGATIAIFGTWTWTLNFAMEDGHSIVCLHTSYFSNIFSTIDLLISVLLPFYWHIS